MKRLRPRLLPLTIIAIVLLLGQKCVALTGLLMASFPTEAAAAETVAAKAPTVLNWDSTEPPPAVCPPSTTVNPSEVIVLSALAPARGRARCEGGRAQSQAGAGRRLGEEPDDADRRAAGGGKSAERAVANQSNANEARWQALVATYSAMDPQAAAGIFDGWTRASCCRSSPA